ISGMRVVRVNIGAEPLDNQHSSYIRALQRWIDDVDLPGTGLHPQRCLSSLLSKLAAGNGHVEVGGGVVIPLTECCNTACRNHTIDLIMQSALRYEITLGYL